MSIFIGISKLFEIFLKTGPSKLFKNYEKKKKNFYMCYFILQCVRYSAAGSEDTRRTSVQFKNSLSYIIKVSQHEQNSSRKYLCY